MRKFQAFFTVLAAVSVFIISFLIGRGSALKNNSNKEVRLYTKTTPIIVEKEKTEDAPVFSSIQIEDKIQKAKEETEPENMLFPCGKKVLNKYSEIAVFSKTMEDWRAHTGIDYEAEEGDEVVAAEDGKVKSASKNKLWGYSIEIEHKNNIVTKYKNLDKDMKVKKGDKVKRGQVIGSVGSSASIESKEKPHLHFELWQDGVVINPESYVY